MAGWFSKIKERLTGDSDDFEVPTDAESYVEIDSEPAHKSTGSKISVRPFVLEEFGDIKPILDVLREGYTIALINIKPIKDRDLVELKRAINKLKKTCEAVEGDIAGFGEDWVAITPSFASIYRDKPKSAIPPSVNLEPY